MSLELRDENPFTGELISKYEMLGFDDAKKVVSRLRSAQTKWSDIRLEDRVELVRSALDYFSSNKAKIAKDITQVFPSMKELINKYSSLESERECERVLTIIDGIGLIISKKVYNFIY